MRYLLLFIVFLQNVNCLTQIKENFTDEEFLQNPTWGGTIANFRVNEDLQAQLDDSQAGTSYLSIPHQLDITEELEWSFWTKQSFSPSGSNYGRFYLLADDSILYNADSAYYLQFGQSGSNDAVQLVERLGGVETVLLQGQLGAISTSFELRVKVVYDSSQIWHLNLDYFGNYQVSKDSVVHALQTWGTFSGWLTKYTTTNATKFYLDDLYLGPKIYDTLPPLAEHLNFIQKKVLQIEFSEALTMDSIENIEVTIEPDNLIHSIRIDSNKLLLSCEGDFQNGVVYHFLLNNYRDVHGNVGFLDTSLTFFLPEEPVLGDLLLTELMIDPSPSQGLPEVEYIEIYNASDKFCALENVLIGDKGSGVLFSNQFMAPHSYILLVPFGKDSFFPQAIGVSSFPSLTNAADAVYLELNSGFVLDSVSYTLESYQSEEKKEGGFSLERRYLRTSCSSISNWQASSAMEGGTPGNKNSIYESADLWAPSIREFSFEPQSLHFQFDEPLHSNLLNQQSIRGNFNFDIDSILTSGIELKILLKEEIPTSKALKIELMHIADCNYNDTNIQVEFLRGKTPEKGDLLLNEILFDPPPGGEDFLELINASDEILNLEKCLIYRQKGLDFLVSGSLPSSLLLNPKEYLVLSSDPSWVDGYYTTRNEGQMLQLTLPNFPNDSGTVVLSCNQKKLDEIHYFENWHSQLIENTEGKTLERLSTKLSTNDPNNWHTAAETVGFGTPGLPNSQQLHSLSDEELSLETPVISPDNDGFEDFLILHYHLPDPGYVANVFLYDQNGMVIKTWENNTLLAQSGSLKWDGSLDDGFVADIGQYILWFEAFHPDSKQIVRKKMTVVVARKL